MKGVLTLHAQYTERKGIFYSLKKMRTDFSKERRNIELDTQVGFHCRQHSQPASGFRLH